MDRPVRIGIIGSGKGSNFLALVEAYHSGTLGCEPVIVLSDVENSGILNLARRFHISSHFVFPGIHKSTISPEAEQKFVALLQEAGVDFVVFAGFMRIIKRSLLEAFPERILNIHPSLLPAFRGLEACRQAIEAGVAETGCTVHLVDSGVDSGKILGQKQISIYPNDTVDTLLPRIQHAEHELYPRIVQEFAKSFNAH